jgi:hypothetical protein
MLHVRNIAHGLGASLVFAVCFYVAGSLLIPGRAREALGRDELPALLGAAVYVVLYWFGVELGIAGRHVALGFTAAVALGALVRYRGTAAALRAVFGRESAVWWGAFGLLYLIAYLYTMPPVEGEYLPIVWTGNIDLLTYIRYTRYLWDFTQSNLVGFGYLNFVYLQTPGLFYLLGWFSMLFGSDPLSAAMPVQFALIALIGVITARISHAVFGLRRRVAVLIACMVIGAPFFRYVVGAYFLSTLMSMPPFLYVLWQTASHRPARLVDVPLMVRFGSAYVLLLFIYPFLLFAAVGAQLAALGLMLIGGMQRATAGAWRETARRAGRTVVAAAVPLGILIVCLFERIRWSLDMVTGLSQVGVAGWPLEIVSPLAVFGFPGVRGDEIQVDTPGLRVWAIAAFCILALALAYLYFWHFRRTATLAQKTLVALAAGSMVAYCAYYLRTGPSYQQWKFASYTILPLTFVVFAAVVRVVQDRGRARVVRAALAAFAAVAILGNLVVHARADRPLVRLPGGLRHLEQVDALPFFRDMTLDVRGRHHLFGTYLALYFLRSKRVHVVSDVFEPSEKLSFEAISSVRPLLLQDYGCEGVGHENTMTIDGVGCLVLSPPSPLPDVAYPFNRSFVFIDPRGMGPREPDGRRNVRPTLNLQISADPLRAGITQDAYVNLSIDPLARPGIDPQLLVFSWGNNRRGEVLLRDDEWISVPVRSNDWTGERAWTLPISIDFPDGRRMLFRELSVSQTPRGRRVTVSR